MSMSDHIKQQVLQEFFAKKSHSPEKRQNWILWFTRVGEPAHILKISYLIGVKAAWHTVLICCTMPGTEQLNPKQVTEVRIQLQSISF